MCDNANGSEKKRFSVALFLKTVLHSAYSVNNAFVMTYGTVTVLSITEKQAADESLSNIKFFSACYGTNWNYLFQTVFLFLALAHDALEWVDKQHSNLGSKIRYWRDVLFCGLVVPYTCFVFGMFWGVYAIDRELVFPRVFDQVIPWWFNQCVHTNILVLIAAETLLQARRNPTDFRLELIFNGAVGVFYAVVYYTIFFLTHRWLYKLHGLMTWWQICLFQISNWVATYIFYRLQFPINRIFHGPDPEVEKSGEVTKEKFVEIKEVNGEVRATNGEVGKTSEEVTSENSVPLDKSWSLTYRTMRNDYQNSSL